MSATLVRRMFRSVYGLPPTTHRRPQPPAAGPRSATFRPSVEALQDRIVPTVSVVGGVMSITGTLGADIILVTQSGSNYVFHESGRTTTVPTSRITAGKVTIVGRGGDDFLANSTALRADLDGGNGHDELVGSSGNDTLAGGPGKTPWTGDTGPTTCSGTRGTTAWPAGTGTTTSTAGPGTTPPAAGPGTTSCTAGPAGTCSRSS